MFDTLRMVGDHRAARHLGYARTAPGCWSAVEEHPARPLTDLAPGARTAGLAAGVVRRLTPPSAVDAPSASPAESGAAASGGSWSDGTGRAASGTTEEQPHRLALLLAARRLVDAPSDAEVLDAAVAFDRLIGWAHAERAKLLSAFADRRPGDDPSRDGDDTPSIGSRWAPDEVGLALSRSRHTARAMLVQATTLTEVLPDVLAAMEAGDLDDGKARVLCDLVPLLGPEAAAEVAARVLPQAGQQPWTRFREAVRRAIHRVDPRGEQERHAKARGERRVSVRQVEDGMATLWALLPAAEAAEAWEMLTRLAKGLDFPDDPDPRTLDARRADLLVDLLTGKLTLTTNPATAADADADADDTDSQSAEAAVTESAAEESGTTDSSPAESDRAESDGAASDGAGLDVAGLDVAGSDGAGSDGAGPDGAGHPPGRDRAARRGTHRPPPSDVPVRDRVPVVHLGTAKPLVQIVIGLDTLLGRSDAPAELVGHGPLLGAAARAVAADGVWKRLVTDPASGALLDHGRTTYKPPAALRDFVTARDHTCRFPGCGRRARDGDIDHLQARADDGDTDRINLHALCLHHHQLKHRAGWQVHVLHDGQLLWTTPTGSRHRSAPYDYRDHLSEIDPAA